MNVLRVDIILEDAVGVQEYKNSVNPGSRISRGISSIVWSRVDRFLALLTPTGSAFQNPVNLQNIQRYTSNNLK